MTEHSRRPLSLDLISSAQDFTREEVIAVVEVTLRDGESQESLLTRFKKTVERSGLLREMKSKRYFVSRSERDRIAARNAIRREAKNRRRAESRG